MTDKLNAWEKRYMLRGKGRRYITIPVESPAWDRLIKRGFVSSVGLRSGRNCDVSILPAGQEWLDSHASEGDGA